MLILPPPTFTPTTLGARENEQEKNEIIIKTNQKNEIQTIEKKNTK